MLLVAIAWLYVVLMVAVVEATSRNGTVFGAAVTLLLYGLLPIGLVAYLFFSPARRRARRAESAAGAAARRVDADAEIELKTGPGTETGTEGDTEADIDTDTEARADADMNAVSAPDGGAAAVAVRRLDPDRGGHAAGVPIAPERKEP